MLEKESFYQMNGGERKMRMEERISRMLITLGITSRLKGYAYLITGLQMAIKCPECVTNITKELYPDIAKEHKTQPEKVERGIRHAILVSQTQGSMIKLNSLLNCEAYNMGDKLTNSRFIALAAERLRYRALDGEQE